MRWKFKRNIVIISLFVFMFTFWGSLTFTKNSKVYADPITGAVILSAGGGELLIAAAPFILAGVLVAGAAYGSYKLTKTIKRHYLDSKVKSIQSSLTQSQIDALNTMGQAYINSPSTFNLDVNSLPAGVLQTYGNSFTQSIDYSNSTQTGVMPIFTTIQPVANATWSKTRDFLKQYNLEVDFSTVYKDTGVVYDITSQGRTVFDTKSTATGAPALRCAINIHVYNPVNNLSVDWYVHTVSTGLATYYTDSASSDSVWSDCYKEGSSNYISYVKPFINKLANTIGIALTDVPADIFGLVGDGSICQYPRIADGSTCKSVDVPSSISASPFPTSSTQDVITVPTSVPADNVVSVPIDKPYTDTTGSTPTDSTGFWTSLWDWLKKILDAILGLPGLIAGGIISALEALKTLVGTIAGYLTSILDFIKAIPDAISTKIDDWIKQKMNDPPGPPNIADLFKVLLLILIALINLLLAAITFVFAMRGIPSNPDFFPTNVRMGIDWIKALNIPYFNLSFYNLVLTIVFVLSLFKVIKTIRTSIYKNFG